MSEGHPHTCSGHPSCEKCCERRTRVTRDRVFGTVRLIATRAELAEHVARLELLVGRCRSAMNGPNGSAAYLYDDCDIVQVFESEGEKEAELKASDPLMVRTLPYHPSEVDPIIRGINGP